MKTLKNIIEIAKLKQAPNDYCESRRERIKRKAVLKENSELSTQPDVVILIRVLDWI